MFGDADGGITIVHFLRPLDSLFEKDEVDSVQCLFWPDMAKHEEFARYAAYLFNNEHYTACASKNGRFKNHFKSLQPFIIFECFLRGM